MNRHFSPYKLFTGIFIPTYILQDQNLNHSAKLVYGALLKFAGNKNYSFPHQETIAELTGLSLSTVKLAIKDLENTEYIDVESPKGADRLLHKGNIYHFVFKESFLEDQKGTKNPETTDNKGTARGAGVNTPDGTELGPPRVQTIDPLIKELKNKELKEKELKEPNKEDSAKLGLFDRFIEDFLTTYNALCEDFTLPAVNVTTKKQNDALKALFDRLRLKPAYRSQPVINQTLLNAFESYDIKNNLLRDQEYFNITFLANRYGSFVAGAIEKGEGSEQTEFKTKYEEEEQKRLDDLVEERRKKDPNFYKENGEWKRKDLDQ